MSDCSIPATLDCDVVPKLDPNAVAGPCSHQFRPMPSAGCDVAPIAPPLDAAVPQYGG